MVDTFCLSDVAAFTSSFIARKYCSLFTQHFNNRSCFRGRVRSQYLRSNLALHLKLFRLLDHIHSCFPVYYICDGCRVYSCALKRRLAILVLTLYPGPIVEDWCDTASEEALYGVEIPEKLKIWIFRAIFGGPKTAYYACAFLIKHKNENWNMSRVHKEPAKPDGEERGKTSSEKVR